MLSRTKTWEEKHPFAAIALKEIAHKTSIANTYFFILFTKRFRDLLKRGQALIHTFCLLSSTIYTKLNAITLLFLEHNALR